MSDLFETGMKRGAVISACGRYRYRLWREWDAELPTCCFVMLNPSTADAEIDDPTIRRCIGFAKREGCGRLEVVNLFAWRATDPAVLKTLGRMEAIGDANEDHIGDATRFAEVLIAAWGVIDDRRGDDIARLLNEFRDRRLQCLGKTRGGHPRHPLYVKADAKLEPYP